MSRVRVRGALPADAPAIAKVHVETWRATYAGLVPDAYLVGMREERQTLMWQRLLGSRGRSCRSRRFIGCAGPLKGQVS